MARDTLSLAAELTACAVTGFACDSLKYMLFLTLNVVFCLGGCSKGFEVGQLPALNPL
jgi:hypothetical protein